MANLIDELRKKVFNKNELEISTSCIKLIRNRKAILDALLVAFQRKLVVGVYSDILGEGMFVTGVHDVYDYEEEPIVMLKRYDLSGALLIRETLALNEIKAVCIFDAAYKHPVIE